MNDDLISRQALMKEFSDFVRASNSSDFAQTPTWNDAVSLVGSMPSTQQQDIARDIATIIENEKDMRVVLKQPRWIPCSERLPDKDGIYLVTHRKFGKLEVTWNIFYGGEHASWLWNDEIIAWMPLPEPYEERRTDDT